MDKLFQNKWAIRVMSLIFAISLYLYVGIEEGNSANNNPSVIPSTGNSSEVQVLDDVPLDVKIDDDYVVSGVPEVVSVSLEGKPRILTPVVRQRNFKVFVDLRDLSEGEHTVNIEYGDIPKELKVYIEPKSIDVEIEKKDAKEFAVDVDFVNQDKLPVGYELGEPEINPEKIKIISSENIINQIATVKVYIDVTDLKESIRNKEVPVSVYDIQGNDLNVRVEPPSVTISVPVERPSKTVPLDIKTKGELPEGLTLSELKADNEIEIFGKREVLNSIDSISTKEIDLSKVDKSDKYDVELDFPDGVIANEEKISVELDLEQKKIFEDLTIGINGSDEDKVNFVSPKTGKMSVTVTGSDKQVGKVTKADIEAAIDTAGLEAGKKHKVKTAIKAPDDVKVEPEYKEVTIELE